MSQHTPKTLCIKYVLQVIFQAVAVLVLWPRDNVPLWGSLPSCEPIDNRRARRLATAAQDAIPPHEWSIF